MGGLSLGGSRGGSQKELSRSTQVVGVLDGWMDVVLRLLGLNNNLSGLL